MHSFAAMHESVQWAIATEIHVAWTPAIRIAADAAHVLIVIAEEVAQRRPGPRRIFPFCLTQ
jgi:hypothetical protein